MPYQSDRRKLKPKRNDKLEHSQRTLSVDANLEYVPQRGSKRPNTELPDLPNNKKRCYGLMHPPSSTVNLANNRLNKLKQNLQASLEIPNVSTTKSSDQNSSTNLPIRDNLNVAVTSSVPSKNIYENLNKWASPPDASSSKNSANNRLSRLKKVINESQYTGSPKFNDSSGALNHAMPLTDISYTPQCSFNSPSQPFKNKNQFDRAYASNSSNKPVNMLNQYSSNNKNFVDIEDPNVKMGNIDKPLNNLSSRILKIRKNTEQLTSLVNSDLFSKSENVNPPKNTKSVSDRLKLVRNFTPLITESNISSRSSLDVQTHLQSLQKSSTPMSNCVKLNRTFMPLKNNNFTTLNNPINDKTSPLSQKSSTKNPDLLNTLKQPSPISERLKLSRQRSTSLSPIGDSKKTRQCKLNNNLVTCQFDIKTTPLSSLNDRLNRKSPTPVSSTGIAKNVMPFTFKEPSTPILTQETLTTLNNPAPIFEDQANADEYDEKMKMTASWIINHQQFSDTFSNSSEVSDNQNSFNVSSGRSDAATHGNTDDCEDMEWTNAEPDNNTEVDKKQENRVEENEKLEIIEKEKRLCIVVDTNIFISELSKLTDIITLKISGHVQPLIYIPWMVVTELDELKDRSRDNNLRKQAFNAIKFINKALSEENPRVKGQSLNDMGNQNHVGTSPDDKIMGACLQALEKYEFVILLSNDLNLKNKAMINNLASSSPNEIIMKIISKLVKTTKTQKIKQKMGMLCSEVICGSAKEAYGDPWTKMDMLANPPWSFLECLKRFKKYWIAVFQEKLLKHFPSTVDKLLKLMTDSKDICDDSPNYVEFVKLSLNVCIFLKDIEDYRGSVENVLNDITKIG